MDEKNKNKKLTAALQKELEVAASKPSWQSSNEGIHEKVNFDDTLWGFELAGGSYYDTPLRVTKVKPDSRADRAGIKVGDKLRTVNGIETNMLTVQEAHDIIVDCGIELKLQLYAPDVEETIYSVYQDEIDDDLLEPKRLRHLNKPVADLRYKGAKTNEAWSICWPCNKKRDILYKESNCFLVPSAYEIKHRGLFSYKRGNFEALVLRPGLNMDLMMAIQGGNGEDSDPHTHPIDLVSILRAPAVIEKIGQWKEVIVRFDLRKNK